METKTKSRTEYILITMNVLTWIAFIGLLIKAGAILFSYVVSCMNPEASKNLYMGLNLDYLRQFSFLHYTYSVSFLVALPVMKAFVLYQVIKALCRVNLINPFTREVANTLEKISYVLLGTWCMALAHNGYVVWLSKRTGVLQEPFAIGEFIFIAGLVFIISQVYKRGVEIQSENDLTV